MEKKYISIVLDDGPLPFMCEIIDLFKEYDFKAGFAIMGDRVTDDTEYMLKYAVDNGFQLVGHSHTHRKLETLTDEEIIKEMTEPVTDIKNRIGYDMKNIARLPCHCPDERVLDVCRKLGLVLIGYGMHCGADWEPSATPERVIAQTLETVCDGAFACMHVREHTYIALKTILPELKNRGYELVTPDEFFKIKGITNPPVGVHIHNLNNI